jgi:hypothetical protein
MAARRRVICRPGRTAPGRRCAASCSRTPSSTSWAGRIYGRTPFADWVPGVLVDTFNRITGPGGTGMSVATCRTLEPVASAAARLAPSARPTGIPGYFSWTLPLEDPRLFHVAAAALHREAARLVEGWHPALRRLIAEADVPATFAVCITSAHPVAPWPEPNVTLLGDAIHTMSPRPRRRR